MKIYSLNRIKYSAANFIRKHTKFTHLFILFHVMLFLSFASMWYPVIGFPPSSLGASHLTAIDSRVADTTLTDIGGPGTYTKEPHKKQSWPTLYLEIPIIATYRNGDER